MATYKKTSPYSQTRTVNNYLDLLKYRPIVKRDTDSFYQIDPFYNMRPDLMAFDMYGDSALWWVFIVRNPDLIKDPIMGFTTGLSIFVPQKEGLLADLGL